jgi:hypothetical protein
MPGCAGLAAFAPGHRPIHEGEILMNDGNRVLTRAGARELTATEVELIGGGYNTL